MTDAVSAGRIREARVQLPFPRPVWAAHYERLLGCPVIFGADHFLVEMPPEQLGSPLPDRRPGHAPQCHS